ncbi:MAG TPA: 3-deoxy-D-manno-octulosonic acid transferase [Geobacteraceae bacterium]
MTLLYNIVLWLALPGIVLYHLYRSVSRERPAALAERFGFVATAILDRAEGRGAIWVHAVSVGETVAAKPLLKALKERYPGRPLVLSNMTETGRSVAMQLPYVDLCLRFPFDYRFAMSRLLAAVRPAVIVIVETEIWPNFLDVAHELAIPTVLVNGRISDRSFGRYRRLRAFFGPLLARFSRICMQSDEDERRVLAIGAPAAVVCTTGNLKFDLPSQVMAAQQRAATREQYHLANDSLVLVAGSTHAGEDAPVLVAYRQALAAGLPVVLVLVPRHPERAGEVAELVRREDLAVTRRSALADHVGDITVGQVLLVDTVGELLRLYGIADLVFVGGSLVPVGGHNLLEPAAAGVPVLFGPQMSNFREVAALVLAYGAGEQVADGASLAAATVRLLADGARRRQLGGGGRLLMAENGGATARNLAVIGEILGPGSAHCDG